MYFQFDFLLKVSVKSEGFSKVQLPKQHSSPNLLVSKDAMLALIKENGNQVCMKKYLPCVSAGKVPSFQGTVLLLPLP